MAHSLPVVLPALLLAAACTPAEDAPCDVPGTICTFAGVPEHALSGVDDVLARTSGLYYPTDVLFAHGLTYVLDLNNHRLRVVDADGFIHTVAGTGFAGIADGGMALDEDIGAPSDAVLEPDGNILFSLRSSNRIDRYYPETGYMSVVAGVGWRGFAGDGGPAEDALFQAPMSLALADDGTLYIADTENHRIRSIHGGEIDTLAGVGETTGYSGDGPASEASMHWPQGLLLHGRELLFADSGNHLIRVIDLDTGMIRELAGVAGQAGHTDGPVHQAEFSYPADIERLSDGTLLIADELNHCVREISPDGVVSTFAGQCGVAGYGGDGGDALDALLYGPIGVTAGPDGLIYISDTGNHIIRTVAR